MQSIGYFTSRFAIPVKFGSYALDKFFVTVRLMKSDEFITPCLIDHLI